MKSTKSTLNIILKISLPILLAVAVAWWQFGSDFKHIDFSDIHWGKPVFTALILAVVLLSIREWGMAWRFKALSSRQLSWNDSIKVSLICDFTSAITPTSAGGSLLSMVFINRRGVNLGRATAITIITLFLDMLFFAVASPAVLVLATPQKVLNFSAGVADNSLAWIMLGIYTLILIFALLLALGIFYKPTSIGNFFVKITRFKLLHRLRPGAEELATGLVDASTEIKEYDLRWWIAPAIATILTWTARMALVNVIFMAFCPDADQGIIFARQIIVTLLLMFVPTPGGSGVGEMLFKTYYADMISGPVIALMAVVWRIFTAYIFIFLGLFVLPSFLKLYSEKSHTTDPSNS